MLVDPASGGAEVLRGRRNVPGKIGGRFEHVNRGVHAKHSRGIPDHALKTGMTTGNEATAILNRNGDVAISLEGHG